MPNTAPQRHTKSAGESRAVAVSFKGLLNDGELLTGTPTVVEVTTTDLTLSSKAVNGSSIRVNNDTCVAGQAVQFLVAGGVAGSNYQIKITVGTNASPAQVLVVRLSLDVVAD